VRSSARSWMVRRPWVLAREAGARCRCPARYLGPGMGRLWCRAL